MSEYIPKVTDEMWLAKKVYGEKMMNFFQGVTSLSQRRQRMRETITLLNIADQSVGKSDTLSSAFERLYREPLHLPTTDIDWIYELRNEVA